MDRKRWEIDMWFCSGSLSWIILSQGAFVLLEDTDLTLDWESSFWRGKEYFLRSPVIGKLVFKRHVALWLHLIHLPTVRMGITLNPGKETSQIQITINNLTTIFPCSECSMRAEHLANFLWASIHGILTALLCREWFYDWCLIGLKSPVYGLLADICG